MLFVALHPGGEVETDAAASAVGHVGSGDGADQLEVCGDLAERVQDQGQAFCSCVCVCVCVGGGGWMSGGIHGCVPA